MTLGINKFTRCVQPLFHRSSWSTDNTMTKKAKFCPAGHIQTSIDIRRTDHCVYTA